MSEASVKSAPVQHTPDGDVVVTLMMPRVDYYTYCANARKRQGTHCLADWILNGAMPYTLQIEEQRDRDLAARILGEQPPPPGDEDAPAEIYPDLDSPGVAVVPELLPLIEPDLAPPTEVNPDMEPAIDPDLRTQRGIAAAVAEIRNLLGYIPEVGIYEGWERTVDERDFLALRGEVRQLSEGYHAA